MRDPYLKAGRLHHVLAALQVSGSAERPERTIKDWAEVLDRNRDESTIAKWESVFEEHPEFFLTYRLPREADLKAALRVRYVFKNFDSKTGKEYSPAEIAALPMDERNLLTTQRLAGDQIQGLASIAIALHTSALDDLRASRFWIPLIAAALSFVGALVGAIVAAVAGIHK